MRRILNGAPLRVAMPTLLAVLLPSLLAAAPVSRIRDPRVLTATKLEKLAVEVGEFRQETGELPATAAGVEGVASDPELLEDGWGFPVRYLRVAGDAFWLLSWGADGTPGGEGDAADILVQ